MKELLVPVGSMESLKVAIFSGADAVYLGGKRFGARAFAGNFDDTEMINAINLCHLYGVKIYVTVNTLIHESEMDEVIEYVKFLAINGVDAVIVQDIGLISLIHEVLPELDIHVSTQAHTTNESTLKFFESMGVSRVVMARETTIDEIDNMSTSLEIEAFIHGALCISYSGECLFSSILMNRSGNRGECAQICRLPFKLKCDNEFIKTDGDYLLSTKELNTSSNFKRIMDSNIYSLKIEGRMKSPEYVGCVTKLYRDLMDKYYNHEELVVNQEYLRDLNVIFNREYTRGFLFSANNKDLMNIKTSNHIGVNIGRVVDIDKKYITIDINSNIHQGDGIRFMTSKEGMILNYLFDEKELLINEHGRGIVKVLNKCNVKKGELVNKTLDVKVLDKYRKVDPKKIEIKGKFIGHVGDAMMLVLTDGINEVRMSGCEVDKSINAPLTKDTIISKINKLNDTAYFLKELEVDIDNDIFVRVSEINELRRKCIDALNNMRIKPKNIEVKQFSTRDFNKYDKGVHFNILVRNENQLKYLLNRNVSLIVPDQKLYSKYKNYSNVYYRTNRVKESFMSERTSVSELGALFNNRDSFSEYYLNIANHYTINALSDYLKVPELSVELSDEEIYRIANYYDKSVNLEVFIYGRIELMLLKYCPLNLLVNKDSICHVCSNGRRYYLVDRNNYEYPLVHDKLEHVTHLLDNKITNKLNNLNDYIDHGINYFRIELLDETEEEIKNILERIGLYE